MRFSARAAKGCGGRRKTGQWLLGTLQQDDHNTCQALFGWFTSNGFTDQWLHK
jgi:hypothetical protein